MSDRKIAATAAFCADKALEVARSFSTGSGVHQNNLKTVEMHLSRLSDNLECYSQTGSVFANENTIRSMGVLLLRPALIAGRTEGKVPLEEAQEISERFDIFGERAIERIDEWEAGDTIYGEYAEISLIKLFYNAISDRFFSDSRVVYASRAESPQGLDLKTDVDILARVNGADYSVQVKSSRTKKRYVPEINVVRIDRLTGERAKPIDSIINILKLHERPRDERFHFYGRLKQQLMG